MITLMSIHTVTPGREDEYVALQQRLWRLTREREPDALRYEHFRGEQPGQFVSLLTFASLAAFLDHQVADYHHEVNWDGLFAEHAMQWLDPLPGANDFAQTELPPLPADLDAGRRAYAEWLPAERPAWWGGIVPPAAAAREAAEQEA